MQILIWKAYGKIDVHCAETAKQLESILSDVLDCVKYATSPEEYPLIEEYKFGIQSAIDCNQLSNAKLFIKELVEGYDLIGEHESFEHFYFYKVKYG